VAQALAFGVAAGSVALVAEMVAAGLGRGRRRAEAGGRGRPRETTSTATATAESRGRKAGLGARAAEALATVMLLCGGVVSLRGFFGGGVLFLRLRLITCRRCFRLRMGGIGARH
jgi:hypothetical protein